MSIVTTQGSIPAALGPEASIGWGRRAFFLSAALFLYVAVGVFDHDVWSPTEPTVAGIVSGMIRTGDVAIPRIHGLPYLEKPPLYYWTAWLFASLAGHLDAGVLRLPSALFGMASLALVWWTSRRFHGEAVAWACALLGATCFSLYEVFHRACTDSAAIFFTFLGCSIFAVSLHPEIQGDRARVRRWDVLLALSLALSFYAKNLYTLLLVLPPVAAFLVLRRRPGRLLFLLLALGGFLALALTPWCLALYRAGGWPYLRVVFLDNTLGRFLDLHDFGRAFEGPLNDAYSAEKDSSPLVYPAALLYLPLPWTPIFVAAFAHAFATGRGSDLRSFLKIALVTMPIALSLSSSKVALYLAPVLWATLLAAGDWLLHLNGLDGGRLPGEIPPRRIDRIVIAANVTLSWILLLAIPLAAWRILGRVELLWPMLPLAVMAIVLALRRRRKLSPARFLGTCCACSAIGSALVLVALVPPVNEERSYRAFFEEIRPELDGRELCTAMKDDRRLPLMDFYLGRPFELLDAEALGFEKLRGPAPVGFFLTSAEYQAAKPGLSRMPHRVLRGTRGKQPLVVVVNPPPLENAMPSGWGGASAPRTR